MCKMLYCEFYLNYLIMILKPAHHGPSAYTWETKVHASTRILSFSLPTPSCLLLGVPQVQRQGSFPTTFSPVMFTITNCHPFFHWLMPAGLILPCLPVPVSLFTSLSLPSGWPLGPDLFVHVFTLPPLLRSDSHSSAKTRGKRSRFVQPGEGLHH